MVIEGGEIEAHNLMRRQAMSLQNSSNQASVVLPQPELQLGGAIVDEYGNQVLITEEMVQAACQECEKYWVRPEKQD
nr:PA1571 family protein [Pseudomonas sp.]